MIAFYKKHSYPLIQSTIYVHIAIAYMLSSPNWPPPPFDATICVQVEPGRPTVQRLPPPPPRGQPTGRTGYRLRRWTVQGQARSAGPREVSRQCSCECRRGGASARAVVMISVVTDFSEIIFVLAAVYLYIYYQDRLNPRHVLFICRRYYRHRGSTKGKSHFLGSIFYHSSSRFQCSYFPYPSVIQNNTVTPI